MAKEVVQGDTAGLGVAARLLASFDRHATAAREWYVGRLEGRHVDGADFADFSAPLLNDRIVSFTYEFTRNGKARTRVYHGRSGTNDPWSHLDIHGRWLSPYAAYFPRLSPEIVVWNREGKAVGVAAERKVARQLDRDIRNGLAEAGGVLRGYASSEPCRTCEEALRSLSDKRGIRVYLSYLDKDGVVWRRFQNMRFQYVASIHAAINGVTLNRPYPKAGDGAPDTGCLASSTEGQDE